MVKTIYLTDQDNFTRKKCNKCGKTKPWTCFHKHSGHKDGLATFCKECRKKKDRIKEYNNKASKRKQAMLELKNLDGRLLYNYFSGAKCYLDKDGYFILEQGYTRVRKARVVYCHEHGLALKEIDGLQIHHMNGNRQFDEKSNLMAISKEEHIKLYHNNGGKKGGGANVE